VTRTQVCPRKLGGFFSFFLFYPTSNWRIRLRDRTEFSFLHPSDKSDINVTIEISRLSATTRGSDGETQNEIAVDAIKPKLGKDVLSNSGHFERSLRVSVFYWARTSADANRIDPTADTILNRMVPEHRRNTPRARYFIFCEATSRRNFSIPMAA